MLTLVVMGLVIVLFLVYVSWSLPLLLLLLLWLANVQVTMSVDAYWGLTAEVPQRTQRASLVFTKAWKVMALRWLWVFRVNRLRRAWSSDQHSLTWLRGSSISTLRGAWSADQRFLRWLWVFRAVQGMVGVLTGLPGSLASLLRKAMVSLVEGESAAAVNSNNRSSLRCFLQASSMCEHVD